MEQAEKQLLSKSMKHPDITFKFPNGKTLYSHKYLLCKDCEYFDNIFEDIKDRTAPIETDDYEVYLYYLCVLYDAKPVWKIDSYAFAARLCLFNEGTNSTALKAHIASIYPTKENKTIYDEKDAHFEMTFVLAAQLNSLTKTTTMIFHNITTINTLTRFDCIYSVKYITPIALWILLNQMAIIDKSWFEYIIKEIFYFSHKITKFFENSDQKKWDILIYVCIKYNLDKKYIFDNLQCVDYESKQFVYKNNTDLHDRIKKFDIGTIQEFATFEGSIFNVMAKIKYYIADDIFDQVRAARQRFYDSNEGYH